MTPQEEGRDRIVSQTRYLEQHPPRDAETWVRGWRGLLREAREVFSSYGEAWSQRQAEAAQECLDYLDCFYKQIAPL